MKRAAVIGVGYLGKYHAEKFASNQDAELIAVVDANGERAQKIAQELGTSALTDYRRLPELGVECASVAADTSVHFEIASWLLENGIDVLVEKPITVTTAEAQKLIEIARERGRILQVGHLERFNPAFRAMQQVLTEPRFFEVRRIAQFSGRAADVDVVRDLMIHDIDLITHLVGHPIESIEAVGVPVITKSVDIANARLTFTNGAVANVTASRAAFKAERTFRIFQPQLYISLDFGNKKLKIHRLSEELNALGFPSVAVEELPVEDRDALRDEIAAFLKHVTDRSQPEVTGEDGMRALELAQAIYRSIESNLGKIAPGVIPQAANF